MALSKAKRLLNATKYKEGTKMSGHVMTMRTRLANVNDLSSTPIDDKTFCGILICSIPLSPPWLPLIPSLYGIPTSTGIIALLATHAFNLYGDLESATSSTTDTSLALAAITPNARPLLRPVMDGPTATGRVEGKKDSSHQPNFGRTRRNPKANTATSSSINTPPSKANTATSHVEHFVMTARYIGHRPGDVQEILVEEVVEKSSHPPSVSIEEINEHPTPFIGDWNGTRNFWHVGEDKSGDSDDEELLEIPSDSEFEEVSSNAGQSCCSDFELLEGFRDQEEVEDFMCDIPVSGRAFVTTTFTHKKPTVTLNFMDSGATDHFMKHCEDFVDFEPGSYDPGASAIKGTGSFKILGKGTAVKLFRVKGKLIRITFKNALLAPSLAANLISISTLDKAGFFTTFGGNTAVVKRKDGTEGETIRYLIKTPSHGTILTQ
ncbi:hypothetical protein EV368DRAFT_70405 [Lentinula lateritia]|nr:hypothetical protein EV368DRAFT_70405 [Lentinula lateritia]